MKYAYHHWKTGKNRKSFVIELPSKRQLSLMLAYFMPSITLDFGVTLVHPKDSFNKAIGREKALEHAISQSFVFKYIVNQHDGRTFFLFTNYIYDVVFSIVKNSENVHLEYIESSQFLPALKEDYEL